jgi:hypothetical protein
MFAPWEILISKNLKFMGMEERMENLDGCQIPCLPKIAEGEIEDRDQPLKLRLKRKFAKSWNYQVKIRLKKIDKKVSKFINRFNAEKTATLPQTIESTMVPFQVGDRVRVRSKQEIEATLDRWHELKGCAMLPEMWQYCDTTQRVFKVMERFLDERDYKVKKTKGIILLENVMCSGTPVFGQCDRSCLFFWREEWLEKI